MSDALEGGCACQAVRYRIEGAPMFVNCCHCSDCQTESGTAFAVNAMFEADRVVLTKGAPEAVMLPTASGKGQQVWRCPDCHVALWSNYGGDTRDALRFVRVGTLDNAAALPPNAHVYTRSKLPWVGLPEGVPAFEGYYRPKDVWPQESQERWSALFR
jgi:hypothetical protein